MAVMQVLADATNRIAEGEVLQLLHVGNPETSESDYLGVIERKTAVLFAAATRLGAMIAGADAATQRACADYGMNLGLAFQIADDVLDYTADAPRWARTSATTSPKARPRCRSSTRWPRPRRSAASAWRRSFPTATPRRWTSAGGDPEQRRPRLQPPHGRRLRARGRGRARRAAAQRMDRRAAGLARYADRPRILIRAFDLAIDPRSGIQL
jgi:hypothetical protein